VDGVPPLSSSKSLTGHSLGAVGAQEAIYTLMMMEEGFIQASANITEMDEVAKDFPIATERQDNVEIKTAMTNNFGFGGTNATLVFRKLD
jgi:3-oxoacyl-[acyl-carrier-protein] synthase-1